MNDLFTNIRAFLDFKLFALRKNVIYVQDLVLAIAVILIAVIAIKWIKRVLVKAYRAERITVGQQFAYKQLSQYFIIVITFILVLHSLKIDLTLLLAGSAALLVGVGLGLQQLFNDLVSGFFLLFEDTVRVDDIIEVDGMVSKVKQIGIRTSKVKNRDGIMVVIPNSKIVSNSVINWTTDGRTTRFKVCVGVAYGTDVEKVRTILLDVASRHRDINKAPKPICRFVDFGNSSLDFELLFWSKNNFRIEDVKSDLRFLINEEFKKNQITIPFPQRDLHIISNKTQAQIFPPS